MTPEPTTRLVIPVGEPGVSAGEVGRKALNVFRMSELGFPVPRGFCVTTAAFSAHLRAAAGAAVDLVSRGAFSACDEGTSLAQLRYQIERTPIAEELLREVSVQLRDLGASRLAVRSSATAEDLPGHSFAGLYSSYLGVSGVDDCLNAVKRCWASLWSDRAYQYRRSQGVEGTQAAMAVLVQELVPADASGVVFTAHPLTGRTDQLLIEAAYGLGEALVSGKVSPDRILVDKATFRVIEYESAEKSIELVPDVPSGVRERAVAEGRSRRPCLGRGVIRGLARLAVNVEDEFGPLQDIEWAVAGRRVFLLQTRPITAQPSGGYHACREVWSNFNTGEVLPDVVSPMTWGIVERIVNRMIHPALGRMGIDLAGRTLIGQVAGRVYFNLNTTVGLLRRIPFGRRIDLAGLLGGEQGSAAAEGALRVRNEDVPRVDLNPFRWLVRLPRLAVWSAAHSLKAGERYCVAREAETAEILRARLDDMSDRMLLAHFRSVLDDAAEDHYLGYSGTAGAYYVVLRYLSRAWLGDRDRTISNRLLVGAGGVESAEAGLELWRLAAALSGREQLRAEILTGGSYHDTRRRIAAVDGGPAFLEALDAFLSQHGHHARGEVDVRNARWSERPEEVLMMLADYAEHAEGYDFSALMASRASASEALRQECVASLRGLPWRRIFDFVLQRARRGSRLRERLKSDVVRRIGVLRSILLCVGRRLAARGALRAADDVFFLRLEEFDLPLPDRADADLLASVETRRASYERDLAVSPPPVVVGRWTPGDPVPAGIPENADVLVGLAVSSGVVAGPARVILGTDSDERVLPGEVLVAPSTDPGWTPYFVTAAAIVMDMGGLLSHGSIIAREYGIPAVVNVGRATRLIKTGQHIVVDGTRGKVFLNGAAADP